MFHYSDPDFRRKEKDSIPALLNAVSIIVDIYKGSLFYRIMNR
jgi:hypothetical protein